MTELQEEIWSDLCRYQSLMIPIEMARDLGFKPSAEEKDDEESIFFQPSKLLTAFFSKNNNISSSWVDGFSV